MSNTNVMTCGCIIESDEFGWFPIDECDEHAAIQEDSE